MTQMSEQVSGGLDSADGSGQGGAGVPRRMVTIRVPAPESFEAAHEDGLEHGIDPRTGVDMDAARQAAWLYLKAIGEDPDRPGIRQSPDRIARASREIFAGLSQDPATILEKRFPVQSEEMVLVRDIDFFSVCEHHLLPFFGVAHVGYFPGKSGVVGLSKLARLVEVYARRPQVQERMTQQIADALMKQAGARGAIVVTQAEHLCMAMRGVKKENARTITSSIRGIMRNPTTRAEAMRLILAQG